MSNPIQSITGYFFEKTFESSLNQILLPDTSVEAKLQNLHRSCLFINRAEDSQFKICAKHIYATVFFASLTVLGCVESLVRTSLFLMAKTVQFFVPKQHSIDLNFHIIFPLLNHARISIETTMKAAACIVTQFIDNSSHENLINKIDNCFQHNYYLTNFAALHFDGLDLWKISRKLA